MKTKVLDRINKIHWIQAGKILFILFILFILSLTGCVRSIVPQTQISGSLGGKPFHAGFPKNVRIGSLAITANTNGTVSLMISNLETIMDPQVITTTSDAQVKLVKAGGEVAGQILSAVPK